MRLLIAFLITIFLAGAVRAQPAEEPPVRRYDVVVYGGTAGGVIAAVAAAREGLKVALLEPTSHIGGMTSGGLGRSDHGKKETIGGYSLEFYQRIGKAYGKDVVWYFEPSVAERVLREMLRQAKVDVLEGHKLRERQGIRRRPGSRADRIDRIYTDNGESFDARVFIDSSYEGDLMAQSGVSYTWGREGVDVYGESLAGVRGKDRNHQFDFAVPAYDANGNLLPEISPGPRGEIGAGDRKVQAYNLRLCLSDDPQNQVPFEKPMHYDSKRYTVLGNFLQAWQVRKEAPPKITDILSVLRLEKQSKTDVNNKGAFSTDYIGGSWEYPNASYDTRARIWTDHLLYTQGLMYFLSHDQHVPESLRAEMRQWGLCRDEFTGNNHWPHQLYVREARRMVGDFVMAQKDIQEELTKPDSIGMGSYNSDSHNVQRFIQLDGTVQNEGNMEVAVKPYEIPYRVLLPKRGEIDNLLVPVCLSASHVAYSTLRMEPVYMILGQAAGAAAKIAIEKDQAVQDIDVQALRQKLQQQKATLKLELQAPTGAPQ